jgi:hypothetical protein
MLIRLTLFVSPVPRNPVLNEERKEAMRTAIKIMVFVCSVMFVCSVNVMKERSQEMTFVGNAEAIIGAPLTPFSYAGAARRTVRRMGPVVAVAPPPPTVVVVNTPAPPVTTVPVGTVVQVLPAGCTSVAVSGVNYSDCGGVFYKTAFQGNNLVYVVVEKPIQ